MRTTVIKMAVIALAAAVLIPGGVAIAQQSPVHAHIGHVTDGWRDTPEGQGLLPTAVAEAEIAARHASLAARDPSNLQAIKTHVGHVLHAIDPTQVENGPGLGYGLKKAATGAATHIEIAAKTEGASQNVITHSTHVATAARSAIARADQIVELARQIQAATSAADAAGLVERLNTLASQLIPGVDANGDGRIGWQEGEGGLQQATRHAELLKRGESMS